jgi:hypothetical protein
MGNASGVLKNSKCDVICCGNRLYGIPCSLSLMLSLPCSSDIVPGVLVLAAFPNISTDWSRWSG